MTEAERLTIQRYEAITSGARKGSKHFAALLAQLKDTVYGRHFTTMEALVKGEYASDLERNEALSAFAEQFRHIDIGTPYEELDLLPRFMRGGVFKFVPGEPIPPQKRRP